MSKEIDSKIAKMLGEPEGYRLYSLHMSAAWLVVEWMRAKGWRFEMSDALESDGGNGTLRWWAEFYWPHGLCRGEHEEMCDNAAEGICMSALSAYAAMEASNG